MPLLIGEAIEASLSAFAILTEVMALAVQGVLLFIEFLCILVGMLIELFISPQKSKTGFWNDARSRLKNSPRISFYRSCGEAVTYTGLLGLFVFGFYSITMATIEQRRSDQAQYLAKAVAAKLAVHADKDGRLIKVENTTPPTIDPWGQVFFVTYKEFLGEERVFVTSAGPDKSLDTKDDISESAAPSTNVNERAKRIAGKVAKDTLDRITGVIVNQRTDGDDESSKAMPATSK